MPLMNQRKEKRKYVARPGIEPRTSDLRVRCPTDCAMRPGNHDLLSRHNFHTDIYKGAKLRKLYRWSYMVLVFCIMFWHVLYCTKFCENISKGFRVIIILTLKFTKRHNSVNNVGGITVLNFCILPDHVLYLYQVSWKYLKGFPSYWADTFVMDRWTERQTDGQTDRQPGEKQYVSPRWGET